MKHYFFIFTLLILSSCQREENKNFADSLSDHHGVEYKVVKQNTLQEGYVVVKNQETGTYTAYDLSNYSSSMNGTDFDRFLNSLPPEGKVTNLEKGIEEVNQTVTEWVDTSYPIYESVYDPGSGSYVEQEVWIEQGYWDTYEKKVSMTVYKAANGLMFEEGSSLSKDLEKWGAALEKGQQEVFKSALINQFGLSEKRSIDVSKLLVDFKKIKERRSLTKEDLKKLSLTLFGVPFSLLKQSYIEGSQEEKKKLFLKVAEFNETNPESVKSILSFVFSAPL